MQNDECNRCGGKTLREWKSRPACSFCIAYFQLQEAYVALQDHMMSDEDLLKLDDVRATCHGGGAAVALAMAGDGQLNLAGLREMLQKGNKKLVEIADKYGGWTRISRLRGIK